MWERYVADGRTMTLQRHVEALGLNREGTGVVVGFAVDQQDRFVDLVGVEERRHPAVDLGNLPEGTALRLESEGRQRSIVGAAARDARGKQVGVRQQVRGHERAVA